MIFAAIDGFFMRRADAFMGRLGRRSTSAVVVALTVFMSVGIVGLIAGTATFALWLTAVLALLLPFTLGVYASDASAFWQADEVRMAEVSRHAREHDASHRLWGLLYLVVLLGGLPFLGQNFGKVLPELVVYGLGIAVTIGMSLREYLLAAHPARLRPPRMDQHEVAMWCRRHYPGETARQMVRNLVEEVGELAGELEHDVDDLVAVLRKSMSRGREGTPEALRGEFGDVMISTYNLAHKLGEDADACLDAKMAKLAPRTPEESMARVERKKAMGLRKGLGEE